MIRYLDSTEEFAVTEVANFNYTHFLCEPREKECSFYHFVMEHLSAFWAPSSVSTSSYFTNETFIRSARRSLSSIYSDESNLTTLIKEARKQNFRELNIILPYALDETELASLRTLTNVHIAQFQTDREFLRVTFY